MSRVDLELLERAQWLTLDLADLHPIGAPVPTLFTAEEHAKSIGILSGGKGDRPTWKPPPAEQWPEDDDPAAWDEWCMDHGAGTIFWDDDSIHRGLVLLDATAPRGVRRVVRWA